MRPVKSLRPLKYLSLEQKAALLTDLENGMTMNEVCDKYKTHNSTVEGFVKQKDRIMERFMGNQDSNLSHKITLEEGNFDILRQCCLGCLVTKILSRNKSVTR